MRALPALALLLALGGVSPARAQGTGAPALAPALAVGAPGTVAAITHWRMQSVAKAQQDGAQVSSPGFAAGDWYAVSGRATVMAGLIENGLFANVFQGDELRTAQDPDASGTPFVVPWWYRSEFQVDGPAGSARTLLRLNGIIASAEVWLNGHEVADAAAVAGAYPVVELDVTRWVQPGTNALALRVHPGDPRTGLLIGWVDWNPTPPDNNMGPWRGVDIVRTGPVQLRFPQVASKLSLPDLARAELTVSVEARNLDTEAHDVAVSGSVLGVALRREVHLAAGESRLVSFSPASDPGLQVRHPQVWWPAGMGAHPVHALHLAAAVDGAASDRVDASFGIRSVSSHLTAHGDRQFEVNGKPVLVRGAGWAPDLFLRDDPARQQAEFRYVANLGLNAIRTEGKLEDERFYDLADRYGIMVLAGWECCDKWEAAAGTGGEPWNAADWQVARASMESEARLLRNHPSVIAFLIGSDHAPPPALASLYVGVLAAERWDLPIIAAAVPQGTAETGPSGLKMEGPYAWVPPSYWYADRLGGAFGFNSELGAGASIPLMEDLVRMLSPQELEALWKSPEARQYHASAAWSVFANLPAYGRSLAMRYGPPRDLADYVAKSQLDNYDNVRAQFEAHNAHRNAARPATGLVYWMLNNAWPSLHWHLYDYYMNPAGAYYGARLANEPLHIQYSYDTREVVLVNQTLATGHALRASFRVRNLDGRVVHAGAVQGIELEGNAARPVATIPALDGLSATYFIELELADPGGRPISRNVYWLATQQDELDWDHSNWYLTPLTRYADLTALQSLPATQSDVHATARGEGEEEVATVTLSVPEGAPAVALFQHLCVRKSPGGEAVLPVEWSDNDVTLWPGESLTLTVRFPASAGPGATIEVSGWNVAARSYPLAAGH